MSLRSPTEDENRAAHYPNANIEKVRHSLPLATRFALLGESEGGTVSPSSDLPRSRIEGVRRCKAYAGNRSGGAVPSSPLHPNFHRRRKGRKGNSRSLIPFGITRVCHFDRKGEIFRERG